MIGINTAIHSETGQNIGLGFAIPSNEAKAIIPDLKRYGYVPRPWFGFMAETMSSQLAAFNQMTFKPGAIIFNIVRHSPAAKAGLRVGDVVIKVAETEIKALNKSTEESTS